MKRRTDKQYGDSAKFVFVVMLVLGVIIVTNLNIL